ncbi:hypothetical protein QBC40DRAFT_347341 [Triangularia verruculosa]|uniref:DUF6594 domain-containing protein n=1 Tax=Triangularia verruculosa TaxID=2587418 RepID=A0AAN6XLT3_9PEZI|nr:hypothetical protein QBC40DRAFT_347341 [Triangularia verruculosa]
MSTSEESQSSTAVESPSKAEPPCDEDEFLQNNCWFRNNRNKKEPPEPRGVAGVVAFQENHGNMELIRDFSYPAKVLTHYVGSELACLVNELRSFSTEHNEELRRLTKNQTRPAGHPPILAEYDVIMQALQEKYLQYTTIVEKTIYLRKNLYPANLAPVYDFVGAIFDGKMLDKGSHVYWDHLEEQCYIDPPPPSWVEKVIYSRVGMWLIEKVFRGPTPNTRQVPKATELFVIFVMQVIGTTILIICPVSIMLLRVLDNGELFALVSVSIVIFSLFSSAINNGNVSHTFLAVIGYTAVLAGFADVGSRALGT